MRSLYIYSITTLIVLNFAGCTASENVTKFTPPLKEPILVKPAEPAVTVEDRDPLEEILNRKCPTTLREAVQNDEEDYQEFKKQSYPMIGDCLYNKDKKSVFEKPIYTMMLAGEFTPGSKLMPALKDNGYLQLGFTDEWFRFSKNDVLRIFLATGTDGAEAAPRTGTYLLINEKTGKIEKLGTTAKLPAYFGTNLSPDNSKAIDIESGFDLETGKKKSSTKIYLFDFEKLQRTKLLYTVPKGKSILEANVYGGYYPIHESLEWLDNRHIQIKLANSDVEGLAKEKSSDIHTGQDEYEFDPKPIIISVF